MKTVITWADVCWIMLKKYEDLQRRNIEYTFTGPDEYNNMLDQEVNLSFFNPNILPSISHPVISNKDYSSSFLVNEYLTF